MPGAFDGAGQRGFGAPRATFSYPERRFAVSFSADARQWRRWAGGPPSGGGSHDAWRNALAPSRSCSGWAPSKSSGTASRRPRRRSCISQRCQRATTCANSSDARVCCAAEFGISSSPWPAWRGVWRLLGRRHPMNDEGRFSLLEREGCAHSDRPRSIVHFPADRIRRARIDEQLFAPRLW